MTEVCRSMSMLYNLVSWPSLGDIGLPCRAF